MGNPDRTAVFVVREEPQVGMFPASDRLWTHELRQEAVSVLIHTIDSRSHTSLARKPIGGILSYLRNLSGSTE